MECASSACPCTQQPLYLQMKLLQSMWWWHVDFDCVASESSAKKLSRQGWVATGSPTQPGTTKDEKKQASETRFLKSLQKQPFTIFSEPHDSTRTKLSSLEESRSCPEQKYFREQHRGRVSGNGERRGQLFKGALCLAATKQQPTFSHLLQGVLDLALCHAWGAG